MLLTLLVGMAEPDCYDLKVRARPVEQIPSLAPDCADCFVMRWPWFVDLKVVRVIDGVGRPGTLRVLTVQHTWYIPHTGTWALRRNDAGGYNAVDADWPVSRCAADALPARAYIRPGLGKTLDDLRAEGLARYGTAPR